MTVFFLPFQVIYHFKSGWKFVWSFYSIVLLLTFSIYFDVQDRSFFMFLKKGQRLIQNDNKYMIGYFIFCK